MARTHRDDAAYVAAVMSREPDRFWEKVDQRGSDDCWPWLGATQGQTGAKQRGYGIFGRSGRSVLAHRIAYELAVGPVPDGLTLDHLCRNRGCVNPRHLEPVTNRENILRGTSPAAIHARQTHCKRGHEFTPENTHYRSRTNERHCRICQALGDRRTRHCDECGRDLKRTAFAKHRHEGAIHAA